MQSYVKLRFDYDDNTGWLVWKRCLLLPNNWNARFAGRSAGTAVLFYNTWYISLALDYRRYLAHRIIWLWHTGEWVDEIDHRDGDGLNNRIDNLRPCTHSQNMMNKEPGQGWEKHGRKYRARLKLDGQKIELGSFDTIEDARAAYLRGRAEYFGEFAR